MSNDIIETPEGNHGMFVVMGQDEYNTKALARTGANIEINNLYTDLLDVEEMVPRATFIFQTDDSKSNAIGAEIVSTDDGEPFINWETTEFNRGASGSDHNLLINRDSIGSHPDEAVSTDGAGSTYLELVSNVHQALFTLDTELASHITEPLAAHLATAIGYDNTISGLAAINVKTAIDEVKGNITTIATDLGTNYEIGRAHV